MENDIEISLVIPEISVSGVHTLADMLLNWKFAHPLCVDIGTGISGKTRVILMSFSL